MNTFQYQFSIPEIKYLELYYIYLRSITIKSTILELKILKKSSFYNPILYNFI